MASEKHTKRWPKKTSWWYLKLQPTPNFFMFWGEEGGPSDGGGGSGTGGEGHQPWMLETPRKSFCLCISLPAGSPVNTSFQMQSAKRLPFPAHVWYEISSSLFRRVLHVPIIEEPAAPAAANSEKIFPKWHHWICVFQRWRGKLDFSDKLWLSPIYTFQLVSTKFVQSKRAKIQKFNKKRGAEFQALKI